MPLVPALQPFRTTIFAQMSALAISTGAINLGQGFPDSDGPPAMLQAAQRAIAEGHNQYPPGPGIPELRQAIAESRLRDRGQSFDPDTEVLVTVGATEAIAAAVIALVQTGDEVVMLEPHYDSYPAVVAMSGARHVSVPLRATIGSETGAQGRFALDLDDLSAAITPRTKMILLNSPHNPTGTVLSRAELDEIAGLAIEHDLIVVTDEVYEYLTYRRHRTRPDRDPAGYGGTDDHHLQFGQDLRRHRLEDRLGLRSGAAHRSGQGRQAVPHLRRRRPVPAGHRLCAAQRDGLGRGAHG